MNAAPRRREGASSLMAWSRQRRFPAEFRIAALAEVPGPAEPPAPETTPDRAGDASAVVPTGTTAGAAAGEPPVPDDLPDRVVADLATEIWRARRKVDGPDAERDAPRAVRWASRYLSAAADRLTGAGIEAHGHDGLRFDVGMELRVLAYQDAPDVTEETVIETVRPSVRRAGRVIQEGEVIVAVPERAVPVPEEAAPDEAVPEQAVPERKGQDDA